jgi:hypothetical protein
MSDLVERFGISICQGMVEQPDPIKPIAYST